MSHFLIKPSSIFSTQELSGGVRSQASLDNHDSKYGLHHSNLDKHFLHPISHTSSFFILFSISPYSKQKQIAVDSLYIIFSTFSILVVSQTVSVWLLAKVFFGQSVLASNCCSLSMTSFPTLSNGLFTC